MQRASRILYKRVMALVSLFLFFVETPWVCSRLLKVRSHLRLGFESANQSAEWQLDKWLQFVLGTPPPDPTRNTSPSNFELAAAYFEGI